MSADAHQRPAALPAGRFLLLAQMRGLQARNGLIISHCRCVWCAQGTARGHVYPPQTRPASGPWWPFPGNLRAVRKREQRGRDTMQTVATPSASCAWARESCSFHTDMLAVGKPVPIKVWTVPRGLSQTTATVWARRHSQCRCQHRLLPVQVPPLKTEACGLVQDCEAGSLQVHRSVHGLVMWGR